MTVCHPWLCMTHSAAGCFEPSAACVMLLRAGYHVPAPRAAAISLLASAGAGGAARGLGLARRRAVFHRRHRRLHLGARCALDRRVLAVRITRLPLCRGLRQLIGVVPRPCLLARTHALFDSMKWAWSFTKCWCLPVSEAHIVSGVHIKMAFMFASHRHGTQLKGCAAGIDVDALFPGLARWRDRIFARPAVLRALDLPDENPLKAARLVRLDSSLPV